MKWLVFLAFELTFFTLINLLILLNFFQDVWPGQGTPPFHLKILGNDGTN